MVLFLKKAAIVASPTPECNPADASSNGKRHPGLSKTFRFQLLGKLYPCIGYDKRNMAAVAQSTTKQARPLAPQKWLVLFFVIQAALWAGVVLWNPPDHEGPLKVAVGLWPGSESLIIARERGVLNDETVRLIEMSWSSAALRAFGNRVVDAAVLTLDEALRLRMDGHDIRVVCVLDVSVGADSLMTLGAIRETEMLRGKKVGVELRTAGMYLLAKALERAGMTLKDVEIVSLNLAETESALMGGEVDAVVTSLPWQSRLIGAGAISLFDSKMIPGELSRLLVVRSDALKSHQAAVQSLVDAHFTILGDITEKLGASERDVIARREGMSWNDFEGVLDLIKWPSRSEVLQMMNGTPSPLDEMADRMVDFMVNIELIPGKPDRTNWIETSIVGMTP